MPSSPASSASSIFDGSNFSDLSIDDDFEFINEFSEDDDRHSLNGLDDDETPNASYVNQQERNRVRTLSADSDEGKIKESSSRLSFSFPDPQSDEHWIETASDDETPELVDTPTFPQTDSQAVNEAEMSQEALDKMCSTVDWVLGTQPSVKEASVMVPEKSVVSESFNTFITYFELTVANQLLLLNRSLLDTTRSWLFCLPIQVRSMEKVLGVLLL